MTSFPHCACSLSRLSGLAVLSFWIGAGLANGAALSTSPAAVQISTAGTSVSPHENNFDRLHGFISRVYVRPLAWFDRFFMNEREEIETNRSFLRVRTGYEWVNKKGFRYQTGLRAKVRLPALQDRLSLVIFGEEEDELARPVVGVQNDDGLAGAPLAERQGNNGQVGFRYLLFEWLNSRIDVDTGLRSELRTQVSARFRQRIPLTEKTLGRLTLTGFWLDRTGFGIRTRVDVERGLSPSLGFRWNTQATHVEEGPGIDWESRIGLDARLNRPDALSFSFVTLGPTQPATVVELYRFSVLYRRALHKEWLFLEVEPGQQWERGEDGGFPPAATAGIRLEVRFQED